MANGTGSAAAPLTFNSGNLQVRVDPGTGQVSLAGPDLTGAALANVVALGLPSAEVGGNTHNRGKVLSSTLLPDGLEIEQAFGAGKLRAQRTFPAPDGLRYEVVHWNGPDPSNGAFSVAAAGERGYGMGEKFNALDQPGKVALVQTFDQPGDQGDRSYKVAPWFVSTRRYGVHFDSTTESRFDLAAGAADRFAVRSPSARFRVNVVYGPRRTDVVSRCTGPTGRPSLPPPGAFGPGISSDVWRSGGEVGDAVETFRGVPGQNLGKSSNSDEGDLGDSFVKNAMDGPSLVIGWWKGKGSHVDFTKPAASAWSLAQLRKLGDDNHVVTKSGARATVIGGFKTDDGEGRTTTTSPDTANGHYIPDAAAFWNGGRGPELRNGYCVEYHKAVAGLVAADGLSFARSEYTGTQAFPGCWAGDNQPNFGDGDGLPSVIVAGLSAAMGGNAVWGHDVGGDEQNLEHPPNDIDLFMRWAQVGCFSPVMRMHRQVKQDHDDPLHEDLGQYPWGYPGAGETVIQNHALDNFRNYAALHAEIFPYVYNYKKRATETGLPIMRPLVLTHQDDPATRRVSHTYLLGEEFLVAPVIAAGNGPRSLDMPKGNWIDFWDNSRHTGGAVVTWMNPDKQTLSLYVRAGAIVPTLLGQVDTLCNANYVNNAGVKSWDGSPLFRIYPDGTSRLTLYDGTEISCQVTGAGTTVTRKSVARAVQLSVLGPSLTAGVRRDGVALTSATSSTAFASAASAWFHDPAAGFLDVKFPHGGGTATVAF